MFSKGIFTIENILILSMCDIFGYRMDIKFSNKINLTIVYMVYKRRTWRYVIVWPQNDVKWNLFFFITRITIRKYPKKKKKKIIPRCTKATITSLGRSDVGEAYVKNACVNTVDKRSKTTMIEKNKRPPSEK